MREYINIADFIEAVATSTYHLNERTTTALGKTRGETTRFMRIGTIFDQIRSNIEDDMFNTISGLDDSYFNVFYGSTEERKKFRAEFYGHDDDSESDF